MSWRPWIIIASMLGVFLVNLVLVVQERLPGPAVAEEVVAINEPLRHLTYRPSNRRNELIVMGLDAELANAVAVQIDRHSSLREKFIEMLASNAANAGEAFCPSAGLPQPYAAARFLIFEENDRRDVVNASRMMRLEEHPWFRKSPVDQIYNVLEQNTNRRAEATLLGVSALLLGREADVLEGRGAWSRGLLGSFGFRRLERDAPSIRVLVIQYFSLMHYLTELANTPDGICG